MKQEFVDNIITYGFYSMFFMYYFLTATSIFNFTVLAFIVVASVLIGINFMSAQLTDDVKDTGKFIGHSLFLSLIIAVVGDMTNLTYGSIFYFGFIKTIIFLNIVMMSVTSGIVRLFREQLMENLSKTNLGRQILDLANYYYNSYIVTESSIAFLTKTGKYFAYNIILKNARIIFNNLLGINTELSDNTRSKTVKNELDKKYAEAKDQIMEHIVQPQMMKAFADTLSNNPMDPMMFNQFNQVENSNPYKKSASSNPMDMSFLGTKQLQGFDDVDDDLEDVDQTETMVEGLMKTESSGSDDSSEAPAKSKSSANSKVTNEDKKKQLRDAIKTKEAIRSGKAPAMPKNLNNMPKGKMPGMPSGMPDMASMMAMPGMGDMMKTMMEGDNLKRLMEQFPPEKMGMQMPKMDPEDMKKMMQMMSGGLGKK
jgi:hypothetical protein